MPTVIQKDWEYSLSSHRQGRIAVFGTDKLLANEANHLASSVLNENNDAVYFTIKNDLLGSRLRNMCKKQGITTYRKLPRTKGHDDKVGKELAIAALAWHVEKFYCVYSVSDKDSLGIIALEIASRMPSVLLAVQLPIETMRS